MGQPYWFAAVGEVSLALSYIVSYLTSPYKERGISGAAGGPAFRLTALS